MTKGNPKWEQFEHKVQELLDLRSTPGSGNQWHDPSDGRSQSDDPYKIMVDCKFTEGRSYSLGGGVLFNWWERAAGLGYHFALPVRFDGTGGHVKEWVTITLDDYSELIDAIRILNGPKRCGTLSPTKDERSIYAPSTWPCIRKRGHFSHHDNGEIEWAA